MKKFNIKIILPILIIIVLACFSLPPALGDLREVFLQAWASILAVFIVFCISQLVYQNIKTPLSSFFTFKIEEHPKISNKKTNYYKVGSVIDGKQLIERFREEKIIGISWNDLGDINKLLEKYNFDKSDAKIRDAKIREAVKDKINELKKEENNQYYLNMSDTYIGQIAGYFVKLLNMTEGDIVSIPVNGKIHLFTVSGEYEYREDLEVEKIAHAVPIDTSSEVIVNLEELDFLNSTPTFKRAVQNRSTIISLNPYAEQINSLIE